MLLLLLTKPEMKNLLYVCIALLLGLFACKEEDTDPDLSNSNNPSPSKQEPLHTCRLMSAEEVLFNFNFPGLTTYDDFRYQNGKRVSQTVTIVGNFTSSFDIDFSYTNELVDSISYTLSSSSFNYLLVAEHDDKGRLTSTRTYFNDSLVSDSQNIVYLSDSHGIYTINGEDQLMFFLDDRGNLIKMKLLVDVTGTFSKYNYYLMTDARNPHYKEARYPFGFFDYVNYNYQNGVLIFNDSTSNHDSIVQASSTLAIIQKNSRGYPLEFLGDSTRTLPIYRERRFSYNCN